jgi:hypothetical protein
VKVFFGETSSTGRSASFPVISAYVRVSSRAWLDAPLHTVCRVPRY